MVSNLKHSLISIVSNFAKNWSQELYKNRFFTSFKVFPKTYHDHFVDGTEFDVVGRIVHVGPLTGEYQFGYVYQRF